MKIKWQKMIFLVPWGLLSLNLGCQIGMKNINLAEDHPLNISTKLSFNRPNDSRIED